MKKFNFEQAFLRLSEISNKLSDNDTEISDSIGLFEEGSKIVLDCKKFISDAILKIEKIKSDANEA
jgi:exodeoxyribonuclease VII small subunit